MIAPLRRVHRVVVTVMVVALPALLIRSVQDRPVSAVVPVLPDVVQPKTAWGSGPGAGADPLVYRSTAPVQIGASLPIGAVLVGTLRGTTAGERKTADTGATCFAYSLARQEVLAIFDAHGGVQ